MIFIMDELVPTLTERLHLLGNPAVPQLFDLSLDAASDDDAQWEAVRLLQLIGSRDVLEHAARWCESDDSVRRARGADVLAQLGKTLAHPENNFPDECFAVVSRLVREETETAPLESGIFALGHIGNPAAVDVLVGLHEDSRSEVRYAVAVALGSFANIPAAAAALLELMRDANPRTRDWATCGVGVLGDLDSDEIRQALVSRLTDEDTDTREEALLALAKRGDPRSLGPLLILLEEEEPSLPVTEAARFLLGIEEDRGYQSAAEYWAALQVRFQ